MVKMIDTKGKKELPNGDRSYDRGKRCMTVMPYNNNNIYYYLTSYQQGHGKHPCGRFPYHASVSNAPPVYQYMSNFK